MKVKIAFNDGFRPQVPVYKKNGDSCADVYAQKSFILWPTLFTGKAKLVDTGFRLELPDGVGVCMRTRSGMFVDGVQVEGTIDNGYRNTVKVMMHNITLLPKFYKAGDRIAQMYLEFPSRVEFDLVDDINSNTDRGIGGFGHTGK